MKTVATVALALVISGFAGTLSAAEKGDPTGTWKWTTMINDQSRESTLNLKLEKDKLTGTMLGRNNQETPIEDATFKDGEVAFKVTRERNGQKFTIKYKGKLDGDTIKGQTEFERDGQARNRDWEAKREKK
jgi:hypothetical protein